MSKAKNSLYPSRKEEEKIMKQQLKINIITLILLFLLTVGFFIFAFICKGPTYGVI